MKFDYSDLPKLSDCDMKKRALFVDLETSGLQHHIPDACTLSVGAVLSDTNGEIEAEFYRVILPDQERLEKMHPKALEVNGMTEEILKAEGVPAEQAWSEFKDWLKEHKVVATQTYYVGQNPSFDLAFIEAEAPDIIKKYNWRIGSPRVQDVIELYSVAQSKFIVPYISAGKSRKGKGGNNLAKHLGVEP